MADIINLRRAKKSLVRTQDAKQAEANRIKFGRSKAEKLQTKAEGKLAAKQLDGHKRDE